MANICVIREWYFPDDTRVSREVEALVRAGHEVDLICATRPGQPKFEQSGGLRIFRVPITRRRSGLARYLAENVLFQLAATALAGLLHLRRRYALVQVHSLPDWLAFAAIVPRLLGARVLLDLHECMPEYLTTRYKRPERAWSVRLMSFLEQASIRFASAVITCTDQMRERFVERGAPAEKISVVLNSFDEDRFDPARYASPRSRGEDFTLVCHGTVDENFGIDIVIRAVASLRDEIPGLRLRVYGEGTQRLALEELTAALGLGDRVWFSRGFLPVEELLPAIAAADAGVVAVRRDAFRDLTHCNKMYDLIALRTPVIISRTRAVEAYFADGCFRMFESENVADLAQAIRELYADPDLCTRLVSRASEVSEPYRWPYQKKGYLAVVARLVAGPGAPDRRYALAAERAADR